MKTKKVRILSSILALAILVCSLSVVSGFVTTAETNSGEAELINNLKTAWGELSKVEDIAKLKTDVLVNQMSGDNTKTPAGVGLTFNANNTFDKSAYDPGYVGGTYYLYGLVFSKKNSTGSDVFFDSNLNSTDNNSFDNAFGDDSLYFTFNPGTVKTAGRMWVILQYNDYGYNNVLYSPVEIATTDSNTDKKIVINDLTFKSAKNDAVIDHSHLSDLLTYTNPANKEVSLYTMKVFFNPGFVTEGSSISGLKTVKKETLPAETEGFTSALEWYNAAKDLDVSGYENAAAFTTALNDLENYLIENDPDFMASELKTAWQAMYEKNTVANIKTEIARNENGNADLSTIGISFTDTSNSETGYTFNKSQHDSAVGYSNFLIFNSLCWDQWSNAYKWFDKGVSDNSFNNAFSQNDDIILTVNTGTLTHTGKLRIILRYGSWNTINKEIEFNESNKEITISFKELFELKNLSDALLRPNASSPDPLSIVRIAFSSDLATNSAKLYPLKTVKYPKIFLNGIRPVTTMTRELGSLPTPF